MSIGIDLLFPENGSDISVKVCQALEYAYENSTVAAKRKTLPTSSNKTRTHKTIRKMQTIINKHPRNQLIPLLNNSNHSSGRIGNTDRSILEPLYSFAHLKA